MTFDEKKKKIKNFWKCLPFKYNNFKEIFYNYEPYKIKLKNLINESFWEYF